MRRDTMAEDGTGELSEEQLEVFSERFEEATIFSNHVGTKVWEVRPGRAVLYLDVEEIHLNGSGYLHGGVYASLIDNAMGLSVAPLVGLRAATTQITCTSWGR